MQCHAFLCGPYFAVLEVIGLKPFSEIHAAVARGHTDVMCSADVLTQFHVLATFLQGFNAGVYIVDGLTKRRPPKI